MYTQLFVVPLNLRVGEKQSTHVSVLTTPK